MKYKTAAVQILRMMGGRENILHTSHCSSRIHIAIKNKELVSSIFGHT